jgi:hypothetical protein
LWITIDRKTFHPSVVERCDQGKTNVPKKLKKNSNEISFSGKALRSVSTEAISISQPLKTAEEEETDTEDLIFEITSLNTHRKIKKEKKEKKEKKAKVTKARSKSSKVVKLSAPRTLDPLALRAPPVVDDLGLNELQCWSTYRTGLCAVL